MQTISQASFAARSASPQIFDDDEPEERLKALFWTLDTALLGDESCSGIAAVLERGLAEIADSISDLAVAIRGGGGS